MRVLIGEISSYKAIVIARYIRELYNDVVLIAYDNKRAIRRFHTKYADLYVHVEKEDTESYILKLAEFVRENSIDFFIPVHSDYIGEILLHKDAFGHSLDYFGDYSDYIKLHEKDKLMGIARECGIRVPKCFETIESAEVPFVVKPTNKSSAKGVRYCLKEHDRDKLKSMNGDDRLHNICQEFVAGQGCGYSVYCKKGEILQGYGHLRLAEYPTSGGSSVYRKGFLHPSMEDVVRRILVRVPWTGFAMFEFKLTPERELVLIEVNPRIWGSINQALEDGIPLFSFLSSEKQSFVKQSKSSTRRTCLAPQVFASFFVYAIKGNYAPIKDYITHRKSVSRDVSLWCDPKGFLSMFLRKL